MCSKVDPASAWLCSGVQRMHPGSMKTGKVAPAESGWRRKLERVVGEQNGAF